MIVWQRMSDDAIGTIIAVDLKEVLHKGKTFP